MSIKEVEAFLTSPYNIAADAKMLLFFAKMSATTAVVLALLVVLSFFVKNFWCRYLCPYGALLGLFSLVSPFRISRDEDLCIDCGKCTASCPYSIRVHEKRSVLTPECTSCLNCVSACPVEDCLSPRMGRRRVHPLTVPALLLGVILSFYLFARATGRWETKVPFEVMKRTYSVAERLSHPR
ncbi:MAG: 4Fe-4S dicluster domain-containing protein [Deltaproteobacteria bacterium]|nr:MAG: 4Fe-4S dicluster domain-containing protein [Deltaproteobacteria bacterium]